MEYLQLSAHYVNEESQEQLKQLIAPLVARTYEDPAFKAEFMADPAGVIERETEVDETLPKNFYFKVIDKTDPYAVYITLPVSEDNLELSEAELEMVAGGLKFPIRINFSRCNENCDVQEAPKVE